MTKDRLAELQHRRSNAWPQFTHRRPSREFPTRIEMRTTDNEPSAREPLITTESKTKQGEFFAQIHLIQTMIEKTAELAEEIKKIRSQVILSMPDQNVCRELDNKVDDIKKLSKEIPIKLKKLEKEYEEETYGRQHTAADRIRQLQIFSVTKSFRDVLIQYNNESNAHRQKCQNLIRKELEIAGCRLTDDEIEKMIDEGPTGRITTSIIIDTEKAKSSLENIQSRQQDIIKLEESIRELRDMFVDLQNLVATQGEMIDNIEYNVKSAIGWVTNGAGDLNTAYKSRKRQRKKKICCCIIIIIIIVVLTFLISLYFSIQRRFLGR